jgi:hypothetical protein
LAETFGQELMADAAAEAEPLLTRNDLIDTNNLRSRWQTNVHTGECQLETFAPVIDLGPVCHRIAHHPDLLAALYRSWGPGRYVVPADSKWVTRAVVAEVITTAVRSLDLKFPEVTRPTPDHRGWALKPPPVGAMDQLKPGAPRKENARKDGIFANGAPGLLRRCDKRKTPKGDTYKKAVRDPACIRSICLARCSAGTACRFQPPRQAVGRLNRLYSYPEGRGRFALSAKTR